MKSIKNINVNDKKVLVRVDYNVPIEKGEILDDTRIIGSLKTINYLLDNGAKIILLSHFGRIKTEDDKLKYSLNIVAKYLSKIINAEIIFIPYTRGKILEDAINNMKPGQIVMIENTRFEDLPKKLESSCDEVLSKYWASLADLFVFDAFGAAHRCHASTYGVSKYLPSYTGFLIEKEISVLDEIMSKDKTIIMGGAKIDDKITVINNLINNTSFILFGGGMSFTFLKAMGYEIGKSIVSEPNIEYAKKLIEKYPNKIFWPIDIVTDKGVFNAKKIPADATGYDIGPKTIALYTSVLEKSNLVLWNGPLGKYEVPAYEKGTKKLMKFLFYENIPTVIAGGDIVETAKKYNFDFYYISTGGGSTLEYLEGKKFKTLSKLNGKIIKEEWYEKSNT